MQNETRRLELSDKLNQMGTALLTEGTNDSDYTVAQSGTLMMLVSGLILNDEDMFIFSELCAMFSAKKILDEEENVDPIEKEIFAKILFKKKIEADARKKGKSNPIDETPKKKRGRKPKSPDDINPEGGE